MSNSREMFGLLTPAWIRQPGRRPGAAGRQAAAVFAGRDLLRTKRVGPGGENEELVFPFRKRCTNAKGRRLTTSIENTISSSCSTHKNSSESMHRGGWFFVAPGGENRWPLTPRRRSIFRRRFRLLQSSAVDDQDAGLGTERLLGFPQAARTTKIPLASFRCGRAGNRTSRTELASRRPRPDAGKGAWQVGILEDFLSKTFVLYLEICYHAFHDEPNGDTYGD